MRLFTGLFLLVYLLLPGWASCESGKPYHYKDMQFDTIKYDGDFFKDVLLEKNKSNADKYEKEIDTIKKINSGSSISPFSFGELDKLDTKNKTVIVIFNNLNRTDMDMFLKNFIPIKPFADMFTNKGGSFCGAASFAHKGENNEKFLIVKEETNGKGFPYVINFLVNIQKKTSYVNRANCYKPAD